MPTPRSRFAFWAKAVGIGVFLVILPFLMRALPWDRFSDALHAGIERWGVWGPLFFAIIYAVAVVCLVPGSLLTLAGGAAFGLWKGTLIVSLAATLGAAIAFLIARHLARERVKHYVQSSPKLSAVDRAIGEQGWKIVALLRLSPAVPFTLQNYLYGVTAVRFWPCILTSWVAMLPGTFLYVYLGSLGQQALSGEKTTAAEWIARGVGLVATIAVTVYIARLARRAIQETIDLESSDETKAAEGTFTPPRANGGPSS